MKNFLNLKIYFLIFFIIMNAKNPVSAVKITFIVKPLSMPDNNKISIAGSHHLIGNWKPGLVELEKQTNGEWKKTIEFERGESIEYKITRGSWETEALDADNLIRRNFELRIESDSVVYIEIPKWKDEIQNAKRKIQGQITGKVVTHKNMSGPGILPRDVLVWLPESYDKNPEKRYPVMYMHDGQQIFDPATSTHGIDWQIDETATDFIKRDKMEEIIVVGNNCTDNRNKEYSDGKEGKAYQNFMVNILKPFIDSNYRTLKSREHTSVMGSSMGGLASFLLIWRHPEIYSMAGCFSPAFFLDWYELKESDLSKYPLKIYIDNGGIGLERRLQPGCDLMLKTLMEKGFELGKNLIWFQDLEAGHSEEQWAKRAWAPILWKYGKGKQEWIKELKRHPVPFYNNRNDEIKEIVAFEKKIAVGISARTTKNISDGVITDLWKRLKEKLIQANNIDLTRADIEFTGIVFPVDENYNIEYFAGIIINESNFNVPENMVLKEIAAGKYLKYKTSADRKKINEAFEYLYEWHLPIIGVKPLNNQSVEIYEKVPTDTAADNDVIIYIPLEK
ncbi:MAG TPA: alpha/beta hydrolase-fold protein [bacterium]|nr:alpha/beta hydrolase-fold protein [bacterium]HPN29768.1 alpha/beta hydrolase-fold protein [bacterium]